MTLGTKVLIGVVAGAAMGVFFGEFCRPLETVGQIYIGLLQMTVLPFVTVVLISKIGAHSLERARTQIGRAGLVLLLLWAVSLLAVLALPLSLPSWHAGSFFSASLVEAPQELDLVGLYLPVNPFHALANDIVPAVVLFSIFMGAALTVVEHKERLLGPLDVVGDTLGVISRFVVRLSPYGTFAIIAGAAGTMSPDALFRISGYVSSYTIGVLFLTFVALPGVVTSLTPFRFGQVLSGFKEAGLTAFATSRLFAVLPMVIDSASKLLQKQGVAKPEADATAGVFVPLGYPFPNAGKLLTLAFIPFAAWFAGVSFELDDYPLLFSVGVLSIFGSPIAAIPFLLDLFELPADLFPLFLVTGVWCARLGDLLGAMHLTAFTLLCAAWNRGKLQLNVASTSKSLVAVGAVGALCLAANHQIVKRSLTGSDASSDLVAGMNLLDDLVPIEVDPAAPDPDALRPGETRRDRLRRTRVLRVGYAPNTPPFSYHNRDGKLVGFDIDLLQGLAYELGLELHFVPYRPGEFTDGFSADHFDIAVGGIRSEFYALQDYDQSRPYLNLHAGLVVPDHRVEEFSTVEKLRRAEGLRIGWVGMGDIDKEMRGRFHTIEKVRLPSVETFLRGDEPHVDALLMSAEKGAVVSMLHPEYSVVVPKGAVWRMPIVIALQKDTFDLRSIDIWVDLQRESGVIDELYRHWILGLRNREVQPRWSVIRDVLGWVR